MSGRGLRSPNLRLGKNKKVCDILKEEKLMDKIDELLARGVEKIYPSKEEFKKALESGRKLKIYIGADPTAPQLHLGHSTNFLILKKLQNLGHKIIILIGDFTGMIGDPTDKLAARTQLTRKQVLENAKSYKEQVSKILDFDGDNPAEIKYNSEWLSKLTPEDFIRLMARVSAQQMLERDMFQKRIKENKPIYLHEFVYPLMQGYDSVAMEVDAEMGGTDQTFNMLMGRQLLKELKNKEKFVITTELLINPKTGKKLMNKSEGNCLGLNDNPQEMFGKILALPDEAIEPVFRLCTNIDLSKINFSGHPMELKKKLALQIVSELHSENAAQKAQEEFEKTFQKGEVAENLIREIKVRPGKITDQLVEAGIVASKSEAKRLEDQGAIEQIQPGLYRIGKKRFVKIT